MAAAVPRMVAMTAASTDRMMVVRNAPSRRVLWNSSAYQLREKPPHTRLLLVALKEKMMSSTMGAYRNTYTSTVKILEGIRRLLTVPPPPLHPRRSGS